jgi:hypothetical protein
VDPVEDGGVDPVQRIGDAAFAQLGDVGSGGERPTLPDDEGDLRISLQSGAGLV